MPSASRCQPPAAISSMNGEPVRYSTRSVSGKGRGELQIRREPDRRVPAVRDEAHAVLLRHPGDAPLLADAADLGDVRLHDVERARFQPGLERLAARQHLAAGDRQRRVLAQADVVLERVGVQRLLEPGDVVGGEHLRGAQRPLVAVGPEGVAAAGVDHQQRGCAQRVARGAHDRLVQRGIAAAKRPPADLEGAKALLLDLREMLAQRPGLVHQQGRVGRTRSR